MAEDGMRERRKDEWMVGQKDGRMDGKTERCADGQRKTYIPPP